MRNIESESELLHFSYSLIACCSIVLIFNVNIFILHIPLYLKSSYLHLNSLSASGNIYMHKK